MLLTNFNVKIKSLPVLFIGAEACEKKTGAGKKLTGSATMRGTVLDDVIQYLILNGARCSTVIT